MPERKLHSRMTITSHRTNFQTEQKPDLRFSRKKPTKDKDNNNTNNIPDSMSFVKQSYFIVHLCIGINMLQNVFETTKKKKNAPKNAPPFNVLSQLLPLHIAILCRSSVFFFSFILNAYLCAERVSIHSLAFLFRYCFPFSSHSPPPPHS